MPRKGREASSTGIYHVMLRGINRQDIFEDAEDYWMFVRILASVQERLEDDLVTPVSACHIYAYCLMPNHVHLLVCEKQWSVGQAVKSIAASYVFYYNRKYGRVGHLFQDRFKSEPCNDSGYFLTLFRYIHQNPVKAGLVERAEDYEYSSWPNDYLRQAAHQVCHTQAAVKRFGMEELTAWVHEPLPGDVGCVEMSERRVLADEEVRELLLQQSGTGSIVEFWQLGKERKTEAIREVMLTYDIGPAQMTRVSGLLFNVVRVLRRGA